MADAAPRCTASENERGPIVEPLSTERTRHLDHVSQSEETGGHRTHGDPAARPEPEACADPARVAPSKNGREAAPPPESIADAGTDAECAEPVQASEPAVGVPAVGEPTRGAAPDSEELSRLWGRIQLALQRRVQREQFETWFRRANLQRVDDVCVCIAVQNEFARDWLRSYYVEKLESAVQSVLGVRRRIDFAVDPELVAAPRPHASAAPGQTGPYGYAEGLPEEEAPPGTPTAHASSPGSAFAPGAAAEDPAGPSSAGGAGAPGGAGATARGSRTPIAAAGGLLWNSDVVLNPHYTFENFVVGPCNRFGHAAAMGTGESPGRNYNPFFLHGRVGIGKTHLLQAVCYLILERWPESRILYLSCETFVNHFISALENGDLAEFRNKYRNVDVLVVDDIHLLANKERTQEEFFHTFNTLYNAGKQIVLSSDSPPKDIPTLQERLVSRFKWGMVTEIEPPCYETRMAIVKRKGKDRGLDIPDDVAQHIAERIDQNVRELEGAVTRLIGYSSMTGKPLSLQLAREALADLFQVRRGGAPSMDDIISVVTEHFGVKLSDLQSKKRTKSIAYPRQVAMYLARKVTRHSLEEVGGYFGGRDHSTVLYAIDRIQKEIDALPSTKEFVTGLLVRLQGGSA